MRNIFKYAAIAAIAASMIPFAAQAHGDREGNFEDRGENRFQTLNLDHINRGEARRGTVTAVASGSFTLDANNNRTYTVTTANASFSLPFDGKFVATDLKVGDSVKVRGSISGDTITATKIVVIPQNKRLAKGKATVSAVNGSTLTVETKSGNTITVNTDSNTSVTKQDGTAGAVSDVQVGSKVKLAGLWDSVLNVLSAIKIKLF